MKIVEAKKNKFKEEIRADAEHLKKLFIMPDSPDKFIEFGQYLLDLIHNFFKDKGGIHSEISLPDLAKLFSNISIPEDPMLLKDVLLEIKNNIISHSVKVGNPYYVGHMTSAVPYFMILLEMIITTLNQNQVKIETAKASTFLEREFIAWMHRLVFNKDTKFYKSNIQKRDISLGNITTDGTMGNLTALLVARNIAFPATKKFPGIRKAGLFEAYKHYGYDRAVILVSRRGHYSIEKIGRLIGIGDNNIIDIPVDSKNKINTVELNNYCKNIEEANQKGKFRTKIIAIVGIAGTTETGNIDNLKELRRISTKYNIFFHVDAAWGGSLLLVDEYKYLFNGIEEADSVTIDAHKLLYAPTSMGIVLFNKNSTMNNIKHSANYIIRPDSVDQGRFTIEGSRPFSVLKPWATIKIFGKEGFRLLFEHAFELSSTMRGLLDRHCNFEMTNYPELFILNYRFVPKDVRGNLDKLMQKVDYSKSDKIKIIIRKYNKLLNELNIELHKAIREEDNSFVSRTILDVPYYFSDEIVILRAITINPLTTPKILKEIIEEQNNLGEKIYKLEFEGRFEKI